jgi:hypothetical protein
MSLCRSNLRHGALALLLAAAVGALPAVMSAQSNETPPKVDLFVGYQWLNPGGTVPLGQNGPPFQPPPPPVPTKLPSMPIGYGVTGTYNFDKWWGLSLDVGGNFKDHSSESTISIGPRFMWRGEGVNFFAHTMLGLNRLSPRGVPSSNGIGAVLGGGIDLKLFKAVSLRLIEADYVLGRHNFTSVVTDPTSSARRPTLSGARLRTGLVFNFGGAPEVAPTASCSLDHNEVMVGEPLHVTVSPSNFNPKHTLKYDWSSNGGKIEGKDTGASIDTAGAAPGSYTATVKVSDPKMKKNGEASCSSNFTVKPLNPPQMSCSASPATVDAGASATITCTCTSPDNATVTVGNWTSTGGSISGSGNSATLNTTGASPGPITINATCTDSRGLTASSTSTVTINNPPPPPPPPPQASKLNECEYPNVKKPWRVDNTCKAALDDVASKLQQDPDAKLVVVGNAGPKEKRKNLAAERAVDVKAYLSGGEAKQNIDPSRIETRTGTAGTPNSEQWIVPSGATFPGASSTTPVDESKVKAIPDHPKPAAKKKAQ